jgi:hypothetical protein
MNKNKTIDRRGAEAQKRGGKTKAENCFVRYSLTFAFLCVSAVRSFILLKKSTHNLNIATEHILPYFYIRKVKLRTYLKRSL